MRHKKSVLTFVFLFFAYTNIFAAEVKPPTATKPTAESDQQLGDFSLSGIGDKGKKSWDLSGKSAEIFSDVVKLKKVVGNNYTQNDTINLTADKGDFNKQSGLVHLEDNVVITTASGTKMTTDTLDWDRKQQIVRTLDKVNFSGQDMQLSGQGAAGQTGLKQMVLNKDVRLDIQTQAAQVNQKEKIVIICDGPLDVDYEKNIAIFNNNVKVEKSDLIIYSDKLEVYFTASKSAKPSTQQGLAGISSSLHKIIALGNVRIIRGENVSYSQQAVYTAADKKITLTGKPQIIIYQTENIDAASGN